jgi:hypothetical protein
MLVEVKSHLIECYTVEAQFATFLMECLEKYGSGLPVDEMFRAKWFSDRIYALIRKIRASDDFSQDDDPTTSSQNLRTERTITQPTYQRT